MIDRLLRFSKLMSGLAADVTSIRAALQTVRSEAERHVSTSINQVSENTAKELSDIRQSMAQLNVYFEQSQSQHDLLSREIQDIKERALLRESVSDLVQPEAIFESEFHCQKTGRLLGANGHPLTDEQVIIWQAFRDTQDDLIINAFAGAGKTSTILTLAHFSPSLEFMYIAYNKEIASETKRKLSEYGIHNVDCRTSHSHALRLCEAAKALKPKVVRGRFNDDGIIDNKLNLTEEQIPAIREFCTVLRGTIDKFITSAEFEMSELHIPIDKLEKYLAKVRPKDPSSVSKVVLEKAISYWAMLIDPNDKDFFIADDVYVKVWQLSTPTIAGFDCILFDEAQDANPPLLDIVLRQDCRKVYVGDKHQQIYSWRGAVNSLSKVDGKEYYLTQSFRFGPAIAIYANSLLRLLREDQKLIGFDRLKTLAGLKCVNLNQPYTKIAYRHATLFEYLMDNILGKEIYFSFAKDYEAWKERLQYCWGLKQQERATKPPKDFQAYKSWDALVLASEDDPSLNKYVDVVKRCNIPSLLKEMDLYHVESEVNKEKNITPQVTLMTAHSSKGAEYDQVVLADDFEIWDRKYRKKLNEEMVRLLYVALTRAKKAVDLNPLLLRGCKEEALVAAGVRKKQEVVVL